jgi:hypothetical protein
MNAALVGTIEGKGPRGKGFIMPLNVEKNERLFPKKPIEVSDGFQKLGEKCEHIF